MLFLFGLFCFSGNILSTADGAKFVDDTITRNPVSNEEMEGAAILIVGQDGKILSVGKLRRENQTLQSSDDNLMQRAIPTQQWSNEEQIQPVRIEIFGTHSCPWCTLAEAKAHEIFDKQNVSIDVYKIDDQKRGEEYRKLSQAILAAARSNLPTVPRISVIDTAGKRWFIGGYDAFENFINSNRNGPAASQTANATQPSSTMNYAFMNIPTTKWTGAPIQPIQIEIFGAGYCGPCQSAKALAKTYLPHIPLVFYDIMNPTPESNQYKEISSKILQDAGARSDHGMPRISVICNGKNGPERLFVGGQLQSLINSMNGSNEGARAQRQSSNPFSQRGQTNRYNIFKSIQQHGRRFFDNVSTRLSARYRGQY